MDNRRVFLKPNLLLEPLYNKWYAWSFLISPATAAMYIANSHLKIMQSFIDAPQLHISANKNPAMIGGPFINYEAGRVPEIRALIRETVANGAQMLELAKALQDLDQLLTTEADGLSLYPLYSRIPPPLGGYVELFYDTNNNASYRLVERLLYTSRYYNEAAQNVALSLTGADDRHFTLSTPALQTDGKLFIEMPFHHEAIDRLFQMRTAPGSLAQIADCFGISGDDFDTFSSFFSEEPPPERDAFKGPGLRIRYFGHACLLIESNGTTVLTDPIVSYKSDGGIPRYTHADLPETIDLILITHAHQDHCLLETLLQLRHKTKTVVVPRNGGGMLPDPSLKLMLEKIGFPNVFEIDELASLKAGSAEVISLPFFGEHADLNIRSKTAYLIRMAGRSVLCAADSNSVDSRLYEHLHAVVGNVDIVFLGMECKGAPLSWLYGPLLTRPVSRKQDNSRRLDGSNCERGLQMVDRLKPSQVYVYAMGQEPWLLHITAIAYTDESIPIVESNMFVEECRKRGYISERLYGQKEIFLEPG